MDFVSDICRDMASGISIKNKRAYFEYHILDTYTAGIKLLGTEIKSIREAKADINDAFCTFIDGQLYVRNMQNTLMVRSIIMKQSVTESYF